MYPLNKYYYQKLLFLSELVNKNIKKTNKVVSELIIFLKISYSTISYSFINNFNNFSINTYIFKKILYTLIRSVG